jgi:hypothetical protein
MDRTPYLLGFWDVIGLLGPNALATPMVRTVIRVRKGAILILLLMITTAQVGAE